MSDTQPTRKYAPFDLTFTDKWEDKEVELSLRFAKPTKMEIKRLQDVAGKNPTQAARNLLLATIHPDDKERLTEALEEWACQVRQAVWMERRFFEALSRSILGTRTDR